MKKIIVTGMVALMLLIPVSANAETPAEQIAKAQAQATLALKTAELAKKTAEIAALKSALAVQSANQAKAQAETISKNVEALRVKTTVQFQLIQKQLTALTKLVKTLA